MESASIHGPVVDWGLKGFPLYGQNSDSSEVFLVKKSHNNLLSQRHAYC